MLIWEKLPVVGPLKIRNSGRLTAEAVQEFDVQRAVERGQPGNVQLVVPAAGRCPIQLHDQGAGSIEKHVLDRDGVRAVSDSVAGGVLDIARRAAGPFDELRESQFLAAAGRPVDDAVVDEVGVDRGVAGGRQDLGGIDRRRVAELRAV